MALSRQLAAIMFADIVGYTAMMQEDEDNALKLRNKLLQNLEEQVSLENGRLLEFKGDGGLCCFTSTIEAVRAATALQLAMQTAPVVPLRIGMHTGDVIFEGNNVYGDGVNIASRLESFATPGSIFISGRVYEDIKNQNDLQAVSLGKFILKNVKDPVEIFAISNKGIIIPDKNNLKGKGKKIVENNLKERSVIVLPFVNMSNDPEQDYFSDGLTEELITNLSKLSEMRVISRTTSMQFKDTKKDIKTIGKETSVNYVMEGSVRKQGDNLRITAQFLDANEDNHLWAETFRGKVDDIFKIQEMVSEKIVEALRIQLTKEEQVMLERRYTDDSEAYQLYLKGRHFWKQRNEEGLNSAITYFQKALEKDPDYALAWAGIADTYSLMGEYTNISRRELYPKQMAAVNKALEIDGRLSEAHISLAISLMLNEWDWKNAEKEFKIGIELNPKYANGRHWYAELLLFVGRTEEAFGEISLAVDLDPFSQGILKDKGIFYYYTGQYNKAIDMAMMTLELNPNFVPVYRLLSLAYQGLKMYDEAISQNQRWGELTGNKIKAEVSLAEIYAISGRKKEAENIIAGIESGKKLSANDHRGMAQLYAALGEVDNAFKWLEKSYQHHEEALCSMKIDPKMNSLRSDPRFKEMLEKIGLDK